MIAVADNTLLKIEDELPRPPLTLRLLPISTGIFMEDATAFLDLCRTENYEAYEDYDAVRGLLTVRAIRQSWPNNTSARTLLCLFKKNEFEQMQSYFNEFKRIDLKPYSVLGEQLTDTGLDKTAGPKPTNLDVLVDPGGYPFLSGNASGAGGASGALFLNLGGQDFTIPSEVAGYFEHYGSTYATSKAVGYVYKRADGTIQPVVHVIGPDFRKSDMKWSLGFEQAQQKLAEAYTNVFKVFAKMQDSYRQHGWVPGEFWTSS